MPTRKVQLDKLEVNILRFTYSDTEIVRMKKTSFWNLLDQCWTREEHWIPLVTYPVKKDKWLEKRILSDYRMNSDKEDKTELKQDTWKTEKEENYWENERKFWKVINVGLNPLPRVVLHKNTVGYTF